MDSQTKVKWASDDVNPASGRLGLVVDGEFNLAIFSVIETKGQASTIRILDSIWPDVVRRGQGVRLLDADAPPPPEMASYVIWSGNSGRPIWLDDAPAGKTPARLLLPSGSHQIIVELPSGGKSGARVEARARESEILLLSGRIPSSMDGMGPDYLRHRKEQSERKPDEKTPHLLWLEDDQGVRCYLPSKALTAPVLKTGVMPRYPASASTDRLQGTVWLNALIAADGHVMQVEPITGPGPSLAAAAVEGVRQWVYHPALLDGKPVPALLLVAIEFRIPFSHP